MTEQFQIPPVIAAYREFGVVGKPDLQAKQRSAEQCKLLRDFAKPACADLRTYQLGDEARAEAIDNVLMRMWRKGPQGAKDGAPATEEELTRWFRKCVGRELISMVRAAAARREHLHDEFADEHRDSDEGSVEVIPDDSFAPDRRDPFADDRTNQAKQRAEEVLWPLVVESARNQLQARYRADFDRDIALLQRICADELTVRDAAEAMVAAGDSDDLKRARATLDTRFTRVRVRFNDAMASAIEDGRLDSKDVVLIEWLRDIRLFLQDQEDD